MVGDHHFDSVMTPSSVRCRRSSTTRTRALRAGFALAAAGMRGGGTVFDVHRLKAGLVRAGVTQRSGGSVDRPTASQHGRRVQGVVVGMTSALLSATLFGLSPWAASALGVVGPTYSFTPTSGPAQTELNISGSGCSAGASVEFEMFRQTGTVVTPGDHIAFATFTATASGSFAGVATVSEGELGQHRTSARCDTTRTVGAAFDLTAPPATTTTTTTTISPPTITTPRAVTTTLQSATNVAPPSTGAGASVSTIPTTTTTAPTKANPPTSGTSVPNQLAATGGDSRTGYWTEVAFLSCVLGLFMLFITPRHRFNRIIRWLDERFG